MSASFALFRLQQVDSRISHIETRLAKIQETLDNDVELLDAREQVRRAESDYRDSEHANRTSEEEAKSQQIKIQQIESSLYGGNVRNPKELQGLEADIVSLKKHQAALEDRELEAMLKVDTSKSALQMAQENLKQIQSRLGDEHRILIDEKESLSEDLNSLKSERQAAVSTITADLLSAYDAMRQQRRGGVAVAEVSDNACGACGTTLTAALQQSARHAPQLVYCPTCGRILYAS
jgi:predicted  nucleic acid-binding Zn-ribbon protein